MIITGGSHKMSRGMLKLRIHRPSRHVGRFTELLGRAARVVTVKLSVELLWSDGAFQALLAVLQWAERGDSADNIMQAVSDLRKLWTWGPEHSYLDESTEHAGVSSRQLRHSG